jgi:aminoglycoside phosphotransferase (APT) family kinase protein
MKIIARLLGERLPGASAGPPQHVTFDVLHYKPLRSCTLHYRGYCGDSSDADEPPPYEAYGKVYRDDRGDVCHRLLKATWEASVASAGRWHAARPLAYHPAERFVLQAAVPGRQFRHLFAELTHDDAGEDELREVERHLQAIAVAIRSLQTSPITWGPPNTFERLLAGHEKNLMYLSRWHTALADEITLLRRELVRLERESPAAPLGIAHGDFAHGNVMIDASGVGIIDFDRACQAEPAYDVAYFLTHMWSFGIRHPRREAHVKRLCEFFRRSYLELAPDVSSQRLALYEALDFVAYVMRNFRKQSHQDAWLNWARHQVSAAWERLDEARRTKGSNHE